MAHLRNAVGPVITLAGRHEETRDLMIARDRLIKKALKHHEAGGYEASVLILLAQIDGLVLDFTDPPFGFFYRAKDHDFEDDQTVAGLPLVLRVVRKAVNRDVKRTTPSDAFERNGIIHGAAPGLWHTDEFHEGDRPSRRRHRVAPTAGSRRDGAPPGRARSQMGRLRAARPGRAAHG